jgi:hypothetical protein
MEEQNLGNNPAITPPEHQNGYHARRGQEWCSLPNFAKFEEGTSVDRRGSGEKISKLFLRRYTAGDPRME